MKLTTPSIVATCVLAQQAAATYNWGSAKSFSNPANTNNECTDDQKSGFDWSDLSIGGFDSYKGFDFSGFDCSSEDGKRSLNARTGSPACYPRFSSPGPILIIPRVNIFRAKSAKTPRPRRKSLARMAKASLSQTWRCPHLMTLTSTLFMTCLMAQLASIQNHAPRLAVLSRTINVVELSR